MAPFRGAGRRSAQVVVGWHAFRNMGTRRHEHGIELCRPPLGAQSGLGRASMQVPAYVGLRVVVIGDLQSAFPAAWPLSRHGYDPAAHLASPPWRAGSAFSLPCRPEPSQGLLIALATIAAGSRTGPKVP